MTPVLRSVPSYGGDSEKEIVRLTAERDQARDMVVALEQQLAAISALPERFRIYGQNYKLMTGGNVKGPMWEAGHAQGLRLAAKAVERALDGVSGEPA